MVSKNKQQWNVIVVSGYIQALILAIFSYFYETLTFVDATYALFGMFVILLIVWLLLKIDILSKIIASKFVIWVTIIGWFILLLAGVASDSKFMEVILICAWILVLFYTPYKIAQIEISTVGKSIGFSSFKPVSFLTGLASIPPPPSPHGVSPTIGKKSQPVVKETSKPLPAVKTTPRTKRSAKTKTTHIKCINCGFENNKSTNNLCQNCGKDMYIKDTNIQCKSCGLEYSSSESECPYCGSSR